MIQSAAVLFREHGIHATSLTDVIAHSGAPRGSIYHHFPHGKNQLAEAAVRWAGEYILAATAAALAEDDPIAAIRASARWWRKMLEESDYSAGCVIVAATLDGERSGTRPAADEAFTLWENALAAALRARGVRPPHAKSVATLIVAAIEGAVILCRAHRSTAPLQRVTEELEDTVTRALESAAASSSDTPL